MSEPETVMSEGSTSADSLDLGEILVRTTRLEPEQLAQARVRQTEKHEYLADILIEEGLLNPEEVLGALGRQLDLPVRSELASEDIDEAVALRISITFAKQNRLLPIRLSDDGLLTVVASNPLDTSPLDDLRLLFGCSEIALELASERTLLGKPSRDGPICFGRVIE